MMTASAFARLVRLPAALTAPGDTLAGAAAAGWPFGARTALLPLSSTLIYWAGMALNDYADRDLDAIERPERPIPAGDVTPVEALAVAIVLTSAGVGIATLAGGRRGLAVALPLAASVWAYDVVFKPTALGPVSMATTRLLDVLLGAGAGSWRRALPAALTVFTHTLGTTTLSRDEVHGSRSAVVGTLAVTGTACAAVAAAAGPTLNPANGWLPRVAGAALALAYLAAVAPAQVVARRTRAAPDIRRAVGASVMGTTGLQAALIARSGAVGTGLALAALLPLGRRLTRRVSAT
ncbi:SCO3242 family prenyltransferase [Cryobacterium roopkundense]|uniref:4-hydroxybenzoate polyprenyltransferase n=3 Tax=Cryobacterium roopkundense TaxID=1001240 RepID=A0A7W8ZY75_9MICO|nr:UbiA family prenyltransferase [Cryobacterium roopkundense]MBB5642331.1 4-hydroxybenzoate polyprenyltransferase [Cryobacterium roopkundense]